MGPTARFIREADDLVALHGSKSSYFLKTMGTSIYHRDFDDYVVVTKSPEHGFDLTVGMSEHERGRSVRDVDGEGGRGRRRGERPRAVLDEGVTQHDIVRARAAERAKRAHQRGSVREPLELERIGTPPKRLAQPRFDQREDARRRLLSGTSETECFKELGEKGIGGVVLVKDPAEARATAEKMLGKTLVTKQTGAAGRTVKKVYLTAGAGGRSQGDMRHRAPRSITATVEQGDAEGLPERDARLVDRGPRPGRDGHREAVVVRAASCTKASNTPSTSGDMP